MDEVLSVGLYEGFEGIEEADRAEGMMLLPRFDYYHLKFEGAEARFSRKRGTPSGHFALRVIAGPDGTAGKPVFDDFNLAVLRETEDAQGQPVRRSDEEYAKMVADFKATLVRVRNHLKLAEVAPRGEDKDAIQRYVNQFVDQEAIFALSVQKARTNPESGEEYDARNRVIWRSIAALDAPVLDKKTKQPTGQTYAQLSMEEIARFNEKQASGGGATGKARSAKQFGSPKPTSFFKKG